MIYPLRWSKFPFHSILDFLAGHLLFGLMLGLRLLFLSSTAAAEEECSTGRIEFTQHGPQVVSDGASSRGGFGGRSHFFDQVCEELIDTEHFRLHYSTWPGSVSIPGTPLDVTISGQRALVAADGGGLQVVDIAVPGRPVVVGSLPIPGSVRQVVADGSTAAVLAEDALHIVRIGDPPAITGRIQFASPPRGLAMQGQTVYVVTEAGLEVIDVTDPAPVQVATLLLPGDPRHVAVVGERIAVAVGGSGIIVIDGSDQAHPVIEAIVDTPGIASGVAIADPLIYVADGPAGLTVLRLGTEGWKMAGNLTSVGAATGVLAKDRYVFVRRLGGRLVLVDCYFPEQPRPAAEVAFFGEANGVALGEEHAYVAVAGHGLQVVSTLGPEGVPWLRQLRDQIRGWPSTSYRDSLAAGFETAYEVFQRMGFRPPLPDGDLGGGRDLIDCYVYHLPVDGGLGYTHPEDLITGVCEYAFSGHIGVDNVAITSINLLKDVAAHELFHLIQIAYDFETDWFLESTAVWASQHVRTWQTLGGDARCWFNTPYLPLWSPSPDCRMYGSAHFWVFQEQTTDETIVRRCLERSCSPDVDWLRALKAELVAQGLDFNRQLAEFARWNYRTGERDDGQHYRPTIPGIAFQAEHAVLPVANSQIDHLAGNAGSNYVRFLGPGRRDTLRVAFRSDPRLVEWREVTLVATRAPNRHREWILDLDKEGRASAVIADWPSYDSACLIVANGDAPGLVLGPADYAFSYTAVESGAVPLTSVARPGPNPTASQTTIAWRLAEESARVKLDVFDLSGRLVRRLADQTFDRGDHQLTWDGMAGDDRRAPSGVYFYRLDLDGALYRGRLVLVR